MSCDSETPFKNHKDDIHVKYRIEEISSGKYVGNVEVIEQIVREIFRTGYELGYIDGSANKEEQIKQRVMQVIFGDRK